MKTKKVRSILAMRGWVLVMVALAVVQGGCGQVAGDGSQQPVPKPSGAVAAGAAQPADEKVAPQQLPEQIVEQWTAAGARVAWSQVDEYGNWSLFFYRQRAGGAACPHSYSRLGQMNCQ